MSMPFFITGLPRSRLSWLSVLFTHSASFCYHGALAGCRKMEDLKAQLELPIIGVDTVGDADPLIGCVAEDFLETFPDSKVVFIHRPFQECYVEELKSVVHQNIPMRLPIIREGLSKTRDGLIKMQESIPKDRQIEVGFHELDQEDSIRRIWKFILPMVGFPELRYRMLDRLKVTQICYKILAAYPNQPFKHMLADKGILCGAP